MKSRLSGGTRFTAASPDGAALFVMGVVQIAVARALDDAAPRMSAEDLITELGTHELRGLGVEPGEAARIARRAAVEVGAEERRRA